VNDIKVTNLRPLETARTFSCLKGLPSSMDIEQRQCAAAQRWKAIPLPNRIDGDWH
jgi:hypothetical protein